MRSVCIALSACAPLRRWGRLVVCAAALGLVPSPAAAQIQLEPFVEDESDAPEVPLSTDEAPLDEPSPAEEPAPAEEPTLVDETAPIEDPAPAEEPAPAEVPSDEPIAPAAQPDEPADVPPDEGAAEEADDEPQTAEFNGIRPGTSTAADVRAAWGKPQEVERGEDGVEQWTYQIDPFPSVIVAIDNRRVESIIINLADAYPPSEVEMQLNLSQIEPTLVRDEVGDALGQAYPERGVLLSFDAASDEPKVIQVILESVGTELYLARAESLMFSHPEAALADIDAALRIDPDVAIAHRLEARILADAGHWTDCLAAAQRAARGAPRDCEAHLLLGLAHSQLGDVPTAEKELKIAAKLAEARPEIQARAAAALGDLYAATPLRDFPKAIEYHQQAMKLAEPLMTDPRQIARDEGLRAMIDGHLGAAYDVAWGNWQNKKKVAPLWLKRAQAYVDASELTEVQTLEYQLYIARAALSACVGLQAEADAQEWIDTSISSARDLLAGTDDVLVRERLNWQLGRAMYDGLQIAQMRGDQDAALELGQRAVAHFEVALEDRKPEATQAYLLARLYFRVGSIYALHVNDHPSAVEWFDKALPVLVEPLPPTAAVDLGRHGESLVSIAVSLWEVGRRDEAVAMTMAGADLMKQAVSDKLLTASALAVPYGNLASMHEQLGDRALASKFESMAADPQRTLRE